MNRLGLMRSCQFKYGGDGVINGFGVFVRCSL